MNRKDLVDTVAREAELTPAQADAAVGAALDAVISAVAKREKVSLPGFGTFEARPAQRARATTPRPERLSRSPPATSRRSSRPRRSNKRSWITDPDACARAAAVLTVVPPSHPPRFPPWAFPHRRERRSGASLRKVSLRSIRRAARCLVLSCRPSQRAPTGVRESGESPELSRSGEGD
jgi:nucleoid DNA-binding protein